MQLRLEQFRNYAKTELKIEEGRTLLIYGANGKGKSNLLEALGILVWGRSWRTQKLKNVIMWDQNHARVTANYKGHDLEFGVSRMPEKKLFKKNSQMVLASEFVGQINAVLFTPEDLNLIYGEPLDRRHFLDRLLIQSDARYLEALTQFHKVIKQRNELLKRLAARADREWELEIWDMKLVEFGEQIWSSRKALVEQLSQHLSDLYSQLAGKRQHVELSYPDAPEDYAGELLRRRRDDCRQCHTTCGPHRDDWSLKLNGEAALHFASRGECRSLVLALKLAELKTLKARGREPILMLDDVFSELDENRRLHLLNAIQGETTIITSTDPSMNTDGEWRQVEVSDLNASFSKM